MISMAIFINNYYIGMTLSEKRTIDIQEWVLDFTLLKEDMALVRLDTSTQDEDSFLSSYDLKTGERLLGGFGISSGGLAAVELGQKSALALSNWWVDIIWLSLLFTPW